MAHAVALEILETELELVNDILKYYDVNRARLKAQGFTVNDASYRHWSTNKAKLMLKRVQLQHTIILLRKLSIEEEANEDYDQEL